MDERLELDYDAINRYYDLNAGISFLLLCLFFGVGILLALAYFFFFRRYAVVTPNDDSKNRHIIEYTLTEQGVMIQTSSLVSRTAVCVPWERIVSVELKQGIFMKLCGISSVRVLTAGATMGSGAYGMSTGGAYALVGVKNADELYQTLQARLKK